MAVVKLIQEKEGLEQKVWINNVEQLWSPDIGKKKHTLILNAEDPAWRGEYEIKRVETVLNYREGEELPVYIKGDVAASMDVTLYLKKKK